MAWEKVMGSNLLLRPLLSTAFTLLILKDLAPKRVMVDVMELLIASIEVSIPTNAVIPMATMEAVINARRRCAFKAAMPCRTFSSSKRKLWIKQKRIVHTHRFQWHWDY